MILAAIIISMMSGVTFLADSVLNGRLFNVYISYNSAQGILESLTNQTNNCTQHLAQTLLNSVANNSDRIFCDAFEQGNVVNSASMFICDPVQTLTEETITHSLYFVYLAIGIFATQFLSHILWTITSSRQSRRMRIAFYRAILKHEIGWFDTNDLSRLGPIFLKYITCCLFCFNDYCKST